jgi:ABC-type phosphate/phosphonate transport system substrate-binding protein
LAEPSELKDELRVLAETKRYTSHPFSANARIPKQIQERVQTAFLNMAKTAEGAELLSRIQMAKPMAVSYKANYQALEALRLNQFVVRSAELETRDCRHGWQDHRQSPRQAILSF